MTYRLELRGDRDLQLLCVISSFFRPSRPGASEPFCVQLVAATRSAYHDDTKRRMATDAHAHGSGALCGAVSALRLVEKAARAMMLEVGCCGSS
jgi:hypothetical protein